MSVTLICGTIDDLILEALTSKISDCIAVKSEHWCWAWGWLGDKFHYGVVFQVFTDGFNVWMNCRGCEETDKFEYKDRCVAYKVIKQGEVVTRKELAEDLAKQLIKNGSKQ